MPEGNTLPNSSVSKRPFSVPYTTAGQPSTGQLYVPQTSHNAQMPTAQMPTVQMPEVQMPTFIPPTFSEPGSRNPSLSQAQGLQPPVPRTKPQTPVPKSRFAVEIPAVRINPNEYAIHPVEAMLQEVTMVSADSFITSVFLTEKEKRDRQLAIKLRAKGVITAPGLPFEESRRKEIDSLLGKGVFKLVSVKDIPRGIRIFNIKLVNKVKG